MRIIEGGAELRKMGFVENESFNDKSDKKRIKYPMHYNIPAYI